MHQLLCTHFRYFKRTPPLSPCTQEHQRAHVADDDPGYKVWAALMAIRKAHCKWQRRTHKGVHQARFGSCNVSSAPLLGRGIMRGSVRGREGDGVILGPAWLLRVLMQLLRVNMCVKGHVEIQLLHAMVRTKMQVRVCAKTQLTAACGGWLPPAGAAPWTPARQLPCKQQEAQAMVVIMGVRKKERKTTLAKSGRGPTTQTKRVLSALAENRDLVWQWRWQEQKAYQSKRLTASQSLKKKEVV
eukprot:1156081-Pelagomonas_calceolata.AAC.22